MKIQLPPPFRLESRYRSVYWIIGIMFLILLLSVFEKRSRLSTNPLSRINSVERLVEKGTWAHLAPGDTTPFPQSIDIIKVDGRVYSSKPPTYPLVMAGESLAMKAVTGMEFYPHRVDYLRMLLLVNQVFPYLIMLWVAFLFLRDFTENVWTINFMLLALSIGLLPFGYAPSINNHTVSAVLFFIAFYLVYRITRKGDTRWWLAIAIGLMCGYAVSIELPGGVFAAWYFFLLLRHDWKLAGIALACMILPMLPAFYVYHEISGHYKPFYLQGELYRFEGSYWKNPGGMDALKETKIAYIFHTLFGRKGLFLTTPLFLLSLIGLGNIIKGGDQKMRLEWLGIAGGILAIFYFVWTRTTNYGGECIGMRWFIPFMPLLMLMAWPVVNRLEKTFWGRVLAGFLLLLSIPWNLEALWIEAFIRGGLQIAWENLFF